MAVKYRIIPIGGGGSGPAPTGTITITDNGQYNVSQYAEADVDVPASAVDEGTKTITENGAGIDVVGYAAVDVAVPGIQPTGELDILNNGTYDVSEYATAVVNVIDGDFDYFYFEATQANSGIVVGMVPQSGVQLYYSIDDKATWHPWDLSNISLSNIGDRVYFYGNNPMGIGGLNIRGAGQCTFGGDITTLLSRAGGMTIAPAQAFMSLFEGSSNIVGSFDGTQFTTIGESAFYHTFSRSGITSADFSNVTHVSQYSFQECFEGSQLTTVDFSGLTEISYNTAGCFQSAFKNCTNLIAADFSNLEYISKDNCCDSAFSEAFYGCTSLQTLDFGKLVSAGTGYIFYGAFAYSGLRSINFSSLKDTGAQNIQMFYQAFKGCQQLTSIDLSSLETIDWNNEGMFTEAFCDCTSLSEVKIGATDWDVTQSYNWLYNVASVGTLYKKSSLSLPLNDPSGVPTGWTVVDGVDFTVNDTNRTITLSSTLPNATIYYTTDGTTPTTSSSVYITPISIPSSANYYSVKAIAVNSNYTSLVAEGGYNNYFYIEAREANTEISVAADDWHHMFVQYSTDKVNWTTPDSDYTVILSNTCDKVWFRNKSSKHVPVMGACNYDGAHFGVNQGSINAGGCLSSLCYPTTAPNQVITSDGAPCGVDTELGFGLLFYNCTALYDINDIVWDIVSPYSSFNGMFWGCTNVTNFTFPAEFSVITQRAAFAQFMRESGITNLDMSNIEYVDTTQEAFAYAFYGCTNLTSVDLSNLTHIGSGNDFTNAFAECSNLSEMKIGVSAWNTYTFSNWMYNVSQSGDFYCHSSLSIPTNSPNGIPTNWTRKDIIDYFYIENAYNGQNTVNIKQVLYSGGQPSQLEYCANNVWNTIAVGDNNVTLGSNERVYLRSANGTGINNSSTYIQINSTENIRVGGDVSTLIDYTDPDSVTKLPDYAMEGLFGNSTTQKLIDCSQLNFHNITELGQAALFGTFQGNQITQIPDLSSITTITNNSLMGTFTDCTLLTSVDLSSITTYVQGSGNAPLYAAFSGCSQLTDVKAPNVTSWDGFATSWLQNTAASGVVHVPSGLCVGSGRYCIPENSTNGIPTGWTYDTY